MNSRTLDLWLFGGVDEAKTLIKLSFCRGVCGIARTAMIDKDSSRVNDALIRHPQSTFVMCASGDSMVDAGISSRDVLLVGRAVKATNGHVVIAGGRR